jgi:hypothetical protein
MQKPFAWFGLAHTVSWVFKAPDKPLIIEVKVKPNARVSQLSQDESGQWLAQLKSLPVDVLATRA